MLGSKDQADQRQAVESLALLGPKAKEAIPALLALSEGREPVAARPEDTNLTLPISLTLGEGKEPAAGPGGMNLTFPIFQTLPKIGSGDNVRLVDALVRLLKSKEVNNRWGSAMALDHRRFPRPENNQSSDDCRTVAVYGNWNSIRRLPSHGIGSESRSRAASRRIGLWLRRSKGTMRRSVVDRHGPGGLDEPAVQLLRGGLLEALQSLAQPAVAAVGDHCQGRVEVDVQSHLAGQAVEVEEVHADAQAVLDPVAAGVADDQFRGVSSKWLERNSVGCSRPRPSTAIWRIGPS